MFKFFKKTIVIPEGTKQLETAVELWSVRWCSLDSRSFNRADLVNAYGRAEFFTSEEDAQKFAQSLTDAYLLIKHIGCHTNITIQKEK